MEHACGVSVLSQGRQPTLHRVVMGMYDSTFPPQDEVKHSSKAKVAKQKRIKKNTTTAVVHGNGVRC